MGNTGEVLKPRTNFEIQCGKTMLREDVKRGMIAKCIRMHGEDYSATSKWQRITKVGANNITFGTHRNLDIRGKRVVYSVYSVSPGRFLKIYDEDGTLAMLYALRTERSAA